MMIHFFQSIRTATRMLFASLHGQTVDISYQSVRLLRRAIRRKSESPGEVGRVYGVTEC